MTHPFLSTDPAVRRRALAASFAAKAATRPQVDGQGRPTEPLMPRQYDQYGQMVEPEPGDAA